MIKTILTIFALTGTAATPAIAAPESHIIRTADLNLSSPAGRDVLDRRIVYAARTLCSVERDKNLRAMAASQKCYDAAVGSARRQARSISGGTPITTH